MDHSHHAGMHMSDEEEMMCNMNMLFTWDTTNLCIIFRGWRITGWLSLIYSLVAVAVLTAGYEAVREASRRYEARLEEKIQNAPRENGNERSSLLSTTPGSSAAALDKRAKTTKAALYGLQVFYSFFIMLLFMTYNGWIMLAVGFGAFIGYLAFGGNNAATKSAACH